MSSKRVGAVDCGTNSIRLLVADVADDGALREVTREMQIVRLGRGIDATGRIAPESMERTLTAAGEYAEACADAACDSVRFVATSASRDAANAEEFFDGVRTAFAAFGAGPEVISGAQEAALSFAGATLDLRARAVPAPYLVVDIGGGSTELVLGEHQVEQSSSVDIGSVRMTERHLHDDPPTEEQAWAALADITAAIQEAAQAVDFSEVATLVGLAGSVTTVTAHALGLTTYDAQQIHGAELSVDEVVGAAGSLLTMSAEQRRGLGFMHPGRVDVIGAGALIWRTVVQRLQRDAGLSTVRTSEQDILDGIALSQVNPEFGAS